MSKKNIALLAGGYSGEYVISIQTAETIEKNLNPELYNTYKIVVSREGWWHEAEGSRRYEVDKNDFSLNINGEKVRFDCVFIVGYGVCLSGGRVSCSAGGA